MVIQPILFPDQDICSEISMYIRKTVQLEYTYCSIVLNEDESVEFSTLFNSFSYEVWKKYTEISNVSLKLYLRGSFLVELLGLDVEDDEPVTTVLKEIKISSTSPKRFYIDYPDCKNNKLSFRLTALSDDCILLNGGYSVQNKPSCDINIALDICTYHREEYVLNTLNRLYEKIISAPDSVLYNHLYVFVTDNGGTLELQEHLKCKNINLVKQGDYGASGGFGRGLLEISDHVDELELTNVIIMDDDIVLSPRVLERLYLFLLYIKPEYRNAFITSATMDLNDPYKQSEFGGVWNHGKPRMMNNGMDMRRLENIIVNDDVSQKCECAGWWFCCIPAVLAKNKVMPMPFFMKRDDQEYSLRNAENIIMLNGIAVWHLAYSAKYASYLDYFFIRNYLLIIALHEDDYDSDMVIDYLWNALKTKLMLYRYKEARLILEAAQSFIRGYEFWIKSLLLDDPEKFLVDKIKKGYRLEAVENLDVKFDKRLYDATPKEGFAAFKRITAQNKDYFKSATEAKPYRTAIGKAFFMRFFYTYGADKVLNLDDDFSRGFVTRRNPLEHEKIMDEFESLKEIYHNRYQRVKQEYKEHAEELQSESFWKKYLQIEPLGDDPVKYDINNDINIQVCYYHSSLDEDVEFHPKKDGILNSFICEDNQSSLCLMELEAVKYASRNINASYYGIFEKDKYLLFSNNKSDVTLQHISYAALEKYGIEVAAITDMTEKYNYIYPRPINIRNAKISPEAKVNLFNYYRIVRNRSIPESVINILTELIKEKYTEYKIAYMSYMNDVMLINNMIFVMDSSNFKRFSSFAIAIAEDLIKEVDTTYFSRDHMKCLSVVGSILLGTYITWQNLNSGNGLDLPRLSFKNVTCQDIQPAFEENNVAIASVSSDYYVPYLSVLIKSIVDCSSEKYNYDIIIFESEITSEHKEILKSITGEKNNISLRFVDPTPLLGETNFYIASENYSKEAYYRLFAPWMLQSYDKLIIMDADIVARGDLGELYQRDNSDFCLSAVKDVAYQGIMNTDKNAYDYAVNDMCLRQPFNYCNTGVMLLNMERIRNEYSFEYVLEYSMNHKFRIQEQDIINVLFEDKIDFLDISWNFYTATCHSVSVWLSNAPVGEYMKYLETKKNPLIVHYANSPKPWTNPEIELSQYFWNYARVSPFYEVILKRLTDFQEKKTTVATKPVPTKPGPVSAKPAAAEPANMHAKSESKTKQKFIKFIKWIISPFFPLFSRRREHLKEFIKKILKKPNRYALTSYYVKHHKEVKKYKFASHFPWTLAYKEKKKIRSLHNIHKGERCFFVGLGPSLRDSDLLTLKKNNEICFAVNNVFPLIERVDWKPTYYLNQEFIARDVDKLFKNFEPNFKKCNFDMSFFAYNRFNRKIAAEMEGNYTLLPIENDWITYFGGLFPMEHFSTDCSKIVNAAFVSMYTLLQIAAYMGFKEVYLIGCDAKYDLSKPHCYEKTDNDRRILRDERNAKIQTIGINHGFETMKTAAQKHGISIYNATRGGYLEIFKRVDFDKLMEEKIHENNGRNTSKVSV